MSTNEELAREAADKTCHDQYYPVGETCQYWRNIYRHSLSALNTATQQQNEQRTKVEETSGDPSKLTPVQYEIIHEISRHFDRLGAEVGIFTAIHSWGDTMDDVSVLEMLRDMQGESVNDRIAGLTRARDAAVADQTNTHARCAALERDKAFIKSQCQGYIDQGNVLSEKSQQQEAELEKLRAGYAAVVQLVQSYQMIKDVDVDWDEFPAVTLAMTQEENSKLREDKEALDWLEAQTIKSPSGISFDSHKNYEEHEPRVFRFMRHHKLGEFCPTLRLAIANARKDEKE